MTRRIKTCGIDARFPDFEKFRRLLKSIPKENGSGPDTDPEHRSVDGNVRGEIIGENCRGELSAVVIGGSCKGSGLGLAYGISAHGLQGEVLANQFQNRLGDTGIRQS